MYTAIGLSYQNWMKTFRYLNHVIVLRNFALRITQLKPN